MRRVRVESSGGAILSSRVWSAHTRVQLCWVAHAPVTGVATILGALCRGDVRSVYRASLKPPTLFPQTFMILNSVHTAKAQRSGTAAAARGRGAAAGAWGAAPLWGLGRAAPHARPRPRVGRVATTRPRVPLPRCARAGRKRKRSYERVSSSLLTYLY